MLLALGGGGCGDEEPTQGAETGACYPNETCDAGLWCASDLCVDLDGEDTELPDEGSESESESESESGDACFRTYLECSATVEDGDSCALEYVACRTGGDSGCAEIVAACDEIGPPPICTDVYATCYGDSDGGLDTTGGTTSAGTTTTGPDDPPSSSSSSSSTSTTSSTSGDDTPSGGDPDCISRGQCTSACNVHIWACESCGTDNLACSSPSDTYEGCVHACEVGFDTNNDIAIEYHSCALIVGQSCSEDTFADCFYSLSC